MLTMSQWSHQEEGQHKQDNQDNQEMDNKERMSQWSLYVDENMTEETHGTSFLYVRYVPCQLKNGSLDEVRRIENEKAFLVFFSAVNTINKATKIFE